MHWKRLLTWKIREQVAKWTTEIQDFWESASSPLGKGFLIGRTLSHNIHFCSITQKNRNKVQISTHIMLKTNKT